MRAAPLLLLALLASGLLGAAEPLFELTAWPALTCADEQHRVAFRCTAAAASEAVISWDGAATQTFPVPAGDGAGLLPLPPGIGLHRGEAGLDGRSAALAIRLVEVAGPWSLAGLRQGLPVDGDGVPVVLVDHRRSDNDRRRERLGQSALPRPGKAPILVGDPLAVPGGDAWRGLAGDLRVAVDERYPQHAALVALATLGESAQPRSIVWCPGNAALFAGTWAEEGRLCAALARRCAALAIRPRLVLALPPWPLAVALREPAERRRVALIDAAQAAGWEPLDLAAIAGEPAQANRLSPGLYADYPVGAAQERVHAALRDALTR